MHNKFTDKNPHRTMLEEKKKVRDCASRKLRNGQFPSLFELYCFVTYSHDLACERMLTIQCGGKHRSGFQPDGTPDIR